MDQKEIGEFIASLRKEKKMTQQDLADKLHVTDRAVSNWENGRRMPDISLFRDLCETLGISVNELVNGQKVEKSKLLSSSDNTIINTLKTKEKAKKQSNNIIKGLFGLLTALIVIIIVLFVRYRNIHPKFDIYSIFALWSDPEKPYNISNAYSFGAQNIFYYGIDYAQICDSKDNCYGLNSVFDYNQISLEKLEDYLKSQTRIGNVMAHQLWDGGTRIYESDNYSIIFCNTTEGNKDIYIGISDMADKLDSGYCGHAKNPIKKFIRTYKILSSVLEEDGEFLSVVLEQNNKEKAKVLVNKSTSLIVGKTYEFTFYTFENYKDTIENIFIYSTLLSVKETDRVIGNQINEAIIVNDLEKTTVELNEVDSITMEIKEGTLTTTSATVMITDVSGHKWSYGSEFRVDRKENGKWEEVESIHDDYAWNLMAYSVDKMGKLEFNHDWSYMYGELPKGYYRLVKIVLPNVDRAVTEKDRKYISVEFEIK
ncbi:MAG: helix-turn-helix domain-containing protein [Bacilli bacterium]|nr:helix-turn-helix domain-containing protein [Bacilli bacterium]